VSTTQTAVTGWLRPLPSHPDLHLQIGYNRAARLIETMEEQGIVTPANNAGKREILIEAR